MTIQITQIDVDKLLLHIKTPQAQRINFLTLTRNTVKLIKAKIKEYPEAKRLQITSHYNDYFQKIVTDVTILR